MPGHSSPAVQQAAPLTPGPQAGPLSLAPVEEGPEKDLDLPSTPETFEMV